MDTGGYSPVIKRPGRETPSSSEVKCVWSYTPIYPYVFMAWCLSTEEIYHLPNLLMLLKALHVRVHRSVNEVLSVRLRRTFLDVIFNATPISFLNSLLRLAPLLGLSSLAILMHSDCALLRKRGQLPAWITAQCLRMCLSVISEH
jgi:hypothetical protein